MFYYFLKFILVLFNYVLVTTAYSMFPDVEKQNNTEQTARPPKTDQTKNLKLSILDAGLLSIHDSTGSE